MSTTSNNKNDIKNLKEKIRLLIIEHLNSGEKLPTEKDLVVRYGVSRTSLREVLGGYEAAGIIISHQGSGRFVQPPNLGAQIVDTWSLLLEFSPNTLLDLLDIRKILEINSLPQAMQGINLEQLQQLHARVNNMKALAAESKTFAHEDREFHRVLFSSTKNVLLEQLLTAFWDLYEIAKMESYHEKLVDLANQHEEILNAFAKQDLDLVTSLLNEQFTDARYQIVVTLMAQGVNPTEDKR